MSLMPPPLPPPPTQNAFPPLPTTTVQPIIQLASPVSEPTQTIVASVPLPPIPSSDVEPEIPVYKGSCESATSTRISVCVRLKL